MRTQLLVALTTITLGVAACNGGSKGGDSTPTPTPTPSPTATSVVQPVGEEGGTVTSPGGVTLDVPAGALDSSQQITIVESTTPAPAGNGGLSNVYEFGPDGTVFAQPVTVSLPLPAGVTEATILWSKLGAPGYEDIGGTIVGDKVVAKVVHFSTGFVAAPTGLRTVSGSSIVTWDDGRGNLVNVPADASALAVSALIVASNGDIAQYPGTGRTDGTFSIPGVPYGEYALQLGYEFFVTGESVIDLGSVRLGRPDRAIASTASTITFNVTNLAPWTAFDGLEAFSPGADTWGFEIQQNWPITTGATELTDYAVDMTYANGTLDGAHLVEGSKGDRFTLAQLSSKQTATESVGYQAMSRIFEPVPFDQVNGGNTVLSGAMVDVGLANTASVDIKGTQFTPIVASINPAVTTQFRFFGVLGQAGGLARGVFSASADFLLLYPPANTDTVATGMAYGIPLAGEWGVYAQYAHYNQVPYQIGTAASRNLRGNLYITDTVAALTAGPIVPRLSGVQNAAINGLPMNAAQAGFGLEPDITWTAPAIGTPTLYRVLLTRVYDNGGVTAFEPIASVRTANTSITVLPTLMVSGQTYVVRIIAEQTERPLNAPNRSSTKTAAVPFFSALLTP